MKAPYITNYIEGLNRLNKFNITEIIGDYITTDMQLAFAYSIAFEMNQIGWTLNDKNNKIVWTYNSGKVYR